MKTLNPDKNLMDSELMNYWTRKRARLLERFKILTYEDLCCPVGKEDEMLSLICNKIGKSRQEVLNIILEI